MWLFALTQLILQVWVHTSVLLWRFPDTYLMPVVLLVSLSYLPASINLIQSKHSWNTPISLNESKYSWNSTIRNPSISRIFSVFMTVHITTYRGLFRTSICLSSVQIYVYSILFFIDKRAITALVVMFTSTWI